MGSLISILLLDTVSDAFDSAICFGKKTLFLSYVAPVLFMTYCKPQLRIKISYELLFLSQEASVSSGSSHSQALMDQLMEKVGSTQG